MKKTRMTAWVVVCSNFHKAVGPFSQPYLALKVAHKLTDIGGCVYFPVPIELEGMVAGDSSLDPSVSTKDEDDYHRGQYL